MSQFYNRYRSLFDLVGKPTPSHHLISPHPSYSSYQQPSHKPIFTPQTVQHRRQSHFEHLNRSPALDEFQHTVLPKLGKKQPIQNFYRLKTDINEATNKMSHQLQNNQQGNFYQLPSIYAPPLKSQHKERHNIYNRKQNKPTRVHFKQLKNTHQDKEQLEQQYFRYYPPKQDSVVEDIPKNYNRNRRIVTEPNESRLKDVNRQRMAKRWEVKVLSSPDSKKHFEGKIPSPKQNLGQDRYKEYQHRQDQLFGIKQNQFAFVNSKLQEIKRSERYYPRGYINQYRDALFRRRKQKNNIEERREKLRMLLYEQDIKYGVL